MLAALILAPALVTTVVNVSIENFAFVPDSVSVQMGDTVRWTNNDASTHTSNGTGAGAGSWASGNLPKNATYQRVFNFIGPFDYRCNIHTSMTAKVVVAGATAIRPESARPAAAARGAEEARDLRGRTIETQKFPKAATPAFRKTGN